MQTQASNDATPAAPLSLPTTYGYSLHANALTRQMFARSQVYDAWGFARLGPDRDTLKPGTDETPAQRSLRYWMKDHSDAAHAALGPARWNADKLGPLNVALLAAWTEALGMEEAMRAAREQRAAEEAHRAAVEACKARAAARRAFLVTYAVESLGLPHRAAHVYATSNGSPRPTPALKAARECVAQLRQHPMERPAPFLLLLSAPNQPSGGTGLGKTTGAVLATMEVVLECANAADTADKPAKRRGMTTFPDNGRPRVEVDTRPDYDGAPTVFFLSVGATSRGRLYGPDADALIERAKLADVLIMDDLASEAVSANGPWLSVVDDLINTRYEAGDVTIITSNATKADFVKLYGGRMADRIAHAGRVLECAGASMRDRTKANPPT